MLSGTKCLGSLRWHCFVCNLDYSYQNAVEHAYSHLQVVHIPDRYMPLSQLENVWLVFVETNHQLTIASNNSTTIGHMASSTNGTTGTTGSTSTTITTGTTVTTVPPNQPPAIEEGKQTLLTSSVLA